MPAFFIPLKEDGSYRKQGCVHLYFELFRKIGLVQHRLRSYCLDQLFQGICALLRPFKRNIFLCEVVQGSCDHSKILYKWPLVAQYAQRASDLLDIFELSWPLSDPCNFGQVDADPSRSYLPS